MRRGAVLVALALTACSGESDHASATATSSAEASSGAATTTGAGGAGAGGAGVGDAGGGGSPIDYCAACGAPAVAGKVVIAAAVEISGVVASSTHPGAFYIHNDSGDGPRFFAIGGAGEDLGTYQLTGAKAVDWEDIARGPCPAGSCVYISDLGDNNVARKNYVVYRVPEPTTLAPGQVMVDGEAIPIAYPDGSHNCETLLVHPTTGTITVVTKVAMGPSSIYEIAMPASTGETQMLAKVGEVTPPMGSPKFTGGDVHPQGAGVLLRTYSHVFYYPMKAGQTVAEAIQGTACSVPVADEGQGEAVAWTLDGGGYVTVGEGDAPPVNAVTCGR